MFSKNSDGKSFIQEIRKRRLEASTGYHYDSQRSLDAENAESTNNLPRRTRFERLFTTRYQSNDEQLCSLGPTSTNAFSQTKQITLTQYFKPPSSEYETQPKLFKRDEAATAKSSIQEVKKTLQLANDSIATVQQRVKTQPTKPPIQEVKPISGFRTAREELAIQNMKKYGHPGISLSESHESNNSNVAIRPTGKSLGMRRQPTNRQQPNPPNFVSLAVEAVADKTNEVLPPQDERLANIDPKMVEMIENEIMKKQEPVSWSDIAGLEYAKSVIEEIVIAALLRPDLYKGLRRPSRGILLFGPPGTGKTLIGRCIASQSKSTFFSISASSITSKYVGESEKMVRALFAVAAVHQPAVIFIDEIDSMLCKRNEGEQEFTRRLKNEFLVQLDGTTTSEDDRIVVVGATNRPQELDEAARRRLVRRLYIPLPDFSARLQMIKNLLTKVKHDLEPAAMEEVGQLTDGYSCADLKSLFHEAALKPLRGIPYEELLACTEESVRPVNKADIVASLRTVRPTVAKTDLQPYLEWNRLYGAVPDNTE